MGAGQEADTPLARAALDSNSLLAVTATSVTVLPGAVGKDTIRLSLDSGPLDNVTWLGGWVAGSRAGLLVLASQCNTRLVPVAQLQLPATVHCLAGGPGVLLVQLSTGQLLSLPLPHYGQEEVVLGAGQQAVPGPPVPCPALLWCEQGVLGLTSRGRLYCGDTEVVTGATSMAMHTSHLLLTTQVIRPLLGLGYLSLG